MDNLALWNPEKGQSRERPQPVLNSFKVERIEGDVIRASFRFKFDRVFYEASHTAPKGDDAVRGMFDTAEALYRAALGED